MQATQTLQAKYELPAGDKRFIGWHMLFGLIALAIGSFQPRHGFFFAAVTLLVITGFIDDRIDLRPRVRFMLQAIAASIMVYGADIRLDNFGNLFGFGDVTTGILAAPITVFAVLGVINAMNMLDGVDGLAGGVALIALLIFAAFVAATGQLHETLLLPLVAVIAGFMLFNTACVVESAFPGWSALYTSVLEFTGGAFELFAVVSDHWINRHGVYFPTYPDFQFVGWSDAAVYLTLGLLVRLLVKSELELRALGRERREREAAAPPPSRANPKAAPSGPRSAPPVREKKPSRAAVSDRTAQTDFDTKSTSAIEAEPSDLAFVVEMAIRRGHWVVFSYLDRRNNRTRRWVRPLRVLSYRGEVYMTGSCRLRGEERTFKFSRMSHVLVVPDRRHGSRTA